MKTLIIISLAVLLSAQVQAARAGEKIHVFVSILPQACFVEQVGGDRVEVEVLVGPGQSPATYEPTPRQIAGLASADIYFSIGVPFEKLLLDKISAIFRDLKIIDTREGINLRRIEEGHGDHPGEEAGGPDPHIWLDPKLVKTQAATVCRELCLLDPGSVEYFRKNLETFQIKLDEADARIGSLLAPYRGRSFLVYHPVFGYFGDSYGLTQVAVEIEGKEPSAKQLSRLIEKAREEGVKVIFVQPQFAKRDAMTIAKAIGGAVVRMNPLPREYLASLEEMAERIRKALSNR